MVFGDHSGKIEHLDAAGLTAVRDENGVYFVFLKTYSSRKDDYVSDICLSESRRPEHSSSLSIIFITADSQRSRKLPRIN